MGAGSTSSVRRFAARNDLYLIVLVCAGLTLLREEEALITYRSGTGTTGKLRCPAASSARTAKITLSLESFKVTCVASLTLCAWSHSGLVVARHSTSYSVANPPGDASHVSVESFSRSFATR